MLNFVVTSEPNCHNQPHIKALGIKSLLVNLFDDMSTLGLFSVKFCMNYPVRIKVSTYGQPYAEVPNLDIENL